MHMINKFLSNNSQNQLILSTTCWNWIWRLAIPENLTHFGWLVMHGCLPTNEFRNLCHLTTYTSCHHCGVDVENNVNTLFDCMSAIPIWLSLCASRLSDFYTHDCKDGFMHNATTAGSSLR